MPSYEWFSSELDIAIVGPETVEGWMHTHAEWTKWGVADIIRVGICDVGGLTSALKAAGLYELFSIGCKIHNRNASNLQLLGMMAFSDRYYGRGLLHPKRSYETYFLGLKYPPGEIDDNGVVELPKTFGLGHVFDWDYINVNHVTQLP